MKSIALSFLAAVLLLPTLAGGTTEETHTLTGEYRWNQGSRGELKAIFTATTESKWDVDFHFRFRGRAHVYSGTAEGSLTEGKLEGKVLNEGRQRTFTFSGRFEDGKFRGTHAEMRGRSERDTGTLTLSPAGAKSGQNVAVR